MKWIWSTLTLASLTLLTLYASEPWPQLTACALLLTALCAWRAFHLWRAT